LAFIEAFRNHGIYPLDVRSLGEDSLRWIPVNEEEWAELRPILPPREVLRTMANALEAPDNDFSNNLIIDFRLGRISFAITKNIGDPKFVSNARLARVRRLLRERLSSLGEAGLDQYPMSANSAKADQSHQERGAEPLALLHRDTPSGDW
jgi:hypothetical protein